MMGDVADGSSTASDDAMQSYNRLVYGYFGLMIVAFLALVGPFGIPLAGAVVLGGHLLFHAPLFVLTGHLYAHHDSSVEEVRKELSSVQNPLTSMWLVDVDHRKLNTESGSIRFQRDGPFGLFSKQYQLAVTTQADETIELAISRDERSIVTAHVSVEPTGVRTRVEITFERDAVHAFSLVLMMLVGSTTNRFLAAHGYDVVEESQSTGFRVP